MHFESRNSKLPMHVLLIILWMHKLTVSINNQAQVNNDIFACTCETKSFTWRSTFIYDSPNLLSPNVNKLVFKCSDKKKSLFFTFCSHIATVWALCSKVFKGTPLNVLQLDWLVVCNSQGLV